MAETYRQDHNLDVPNSATHAEGIYTVALKEFPESYDLHLSASYFYLSLNPKYAPKGEEMLDRLREIVGNKEDFEVERGYVFAFLYQNRTKEAMAQLEHCLRLRDDVMLRKVLDALRNGKMKVHTK